MRESVTYQAVLEEGREEGLEKGLERGRQEGRVEEQRSLVANLLREGAAIDLIARVTGWSVAEVTQLKQANHL
jgi:predicted transposase/invertase (TIGR01784 family)